MWHGRQIATASAAGVFEEVNFRWPDVAGRATAAECQRYRCPARSRPSCAPDTCRTKVMRVPAETHPAGGAIPRVEMQLAAADGDISRIPVAIGIAARLPGVSTPVRRQGVTGEVRRIGQPPARNIPWHSRTGQGPRPRRRRPGWLAPPLVGVGLGAGETLPVDSSKRPPAPGTVVPDRAGDFAVSAVGNRTQADVPDHGRRTDAQHHDENGGYRY